MRWKSFFSLLVFLAGVPALCQQGDHPVASPNKPAAHQAATAPDASPPGAAVTLSNEEICKLIRRAAENDIQNDKRLRDYTFVKRQVERQLNGKGGVKSAESKTYEVMVLYDEQVERLVAKDDKPLPDKDAAKEEEKIRRIIDKRENETADQRRKRLEHEEKNREEQREFLQEVSDAYSFRLAGIDDLGGRETYVIDATPRPGFQPHRREAKILPKFRVRVWIDKTDTQWVKLQAQVIDTVSFGWFLARLYKGSQLLIEATRMNDEVWLPRYVDVKVDGRLALLKNLDMEMEVTFRDYKKFRTDTRIVPIGEARREH
jgi:hypothetical protein